MPKEKDNCSDGMAERGMLKPFFKIRSGRFMKSAFSSYTDSPVIRTLLRLGTLHDLDPEEKHRRLVTIFVLLTGIGVTAFFSLFHFLFERYFIVSLNLTISGLFIICLLVLRRRREGRPVYRIITLLFIVILNMIIIEGRKEISYFLWAFLFPTAVFSALGKRDGSIANLTFFFTSLFGMTAGKPLFESEPYSSQILTRYIIAYTAISVITYSYESSQQTLFLYMKREKDRFEKAAKHDPLTKLFNRAALQQRMTEEHQRQKRLGKPFSLILCDIDHFKSLNDTYGHDCGDFILVNLAEVLRGQLRELDCPARWGGEEFLILLADTDQEHCRIVAERIRRQIEGTAFRYGDITLSLTITLGLSTCNSAEENPEEAIKKADQALYAGKRKGRNCVVAGGDPGCP